MCASMRVRNMRICAAQLPAWVHYGPTQSNESAGFETSCSVSYLLCHYWERQDIPAQHNTMAYLNIIYPSAIDVY